MPGTNTYIDGESHYWTSLEAWRRLTANKNATLQEIAYTKDHDDRLFLIDHDHTVFWSKKFSPQTRCQYFTACNTDNKIQYEAKIAMQEFGLEPYVISETKDLKRQRSNTLETFQIIEKPKGVDALLFVRLLDDAHNGRFDSCHIYTSDADYWPVVEAVRQLGFPVTLFGFDRGLGKLSPLRIAATQFVELEDVYREQFVSKASAIPNQEAQR